MRAVTVFLGLAIVCGVLATTAYASETEFEAEDDAESEFDSEAEESVEQTLARLKHRVEARRLSAHSAAGDSQRVCSGVTKTEIMTAHGSGANGGTSLCAKSSTRAAAVTANTGLHAATCCNTRACSAGGTKEAWKCCVDKRTASTAAFAKCKSDIVGCKNEWSKSAQTQITEIIQWITAQEPGHAQALRTARTQLAACGTTGGGGGGGPVPGTGRGGR